jgi:glycerol-3-phosphate O-acyltransferase
VHFSYERIIEGGSYLKELRGGEKERESLLGLLRSARQFLRQRFGGVTVTFGEPLPLPAFLAQRPTAGPEDSATLRTLGATLLGRINAVAPANGIGRLALLFLAAPKARLREQQAIESLKTLEALLQNLPLSPLQEHPGLEASALLARGEEDGLLERIEDPLGPVLSAKRAAPYLLWYRNGLAHCVILPAVLLALVNRPRSEAYLEAAMTRLAPLLSHAWKLPREDDGLPTLQAQLTALEETGLLLRGRCRGWHPSPHPLAPLLAKLGTDMLHRLYLAGQLLSTRPGLDSKTFETRWESLILRWTSVLEGDETSFAAERHDLALALEEGGFATLRDGSLFPTELLTQTLRLGRSAIDPALQSQFTKPQALFAEDNQP